MGTTEFQFTAPPEAPTFEPTWEEFQNPLEYLNKIRPEAEKAGICKIRPPVDWQPPFAVDVDNFKFTPRIQRLNELEAKTRIKLNFLDQIAKFWELQGSSLKIPVVERKALDLYTLHSLVQEEGGKDVVTKDRKWSKIATRMGLPVNKSLGSLLRNHYERILYPYDVFQNGKAPAGIKLEEEMEIDEKDRDYKPHGIPSRQAVKPPQEKGRRSKRYGDSLEAQGDDSSSNDNKELRRLMFYGAGPKMAGYNTRREETKDKPRGKKVNYDFDPLAKYVCHNCNRGDAEESMLLCDGCDDSYHTFCLIPPLLEVPKGDWRCPKCVAEEVSKPVEAFGFEQAQREYTLQQFGEMADQFKSEYFNMPVHLVPPELVEKEFWRIVSSIDEDVTVEYGADLHTMDHGSGFPTKNSKHLLPGDEEYANSGWNLNNLPVLEGSVLGHINADISGMKVPWMYVGMCFATFCWHNEDHWSYSINYLHWGEPKTWYGVPGSKAEEFEGAMRVSAPELFQSQPDLLHQLVTIMNPNILMNQSVPVYRTNQHAGEFVVTFPRAYHAGFNQGYNFAEAVNFAPADWLGIGRECVLHYSNLRRFCVFSHDELVCKMTAHPESLNLTVAAASYQDMLKMVETEKKLRKILLDWGVTQAERDAFELLPDDERQCDVCKTTCFLSAVSCSCTKDRLVCLRHFKMLCECPPENHKLRYRYTLDELPQFLRKLKDRAESFDTWASTVKQALLSSADDKLELSELKELVQEAEQRKFPGSELLQKLKEAVSEAEKCASIAQQLASKKVRTRTRQAGEAKFKLTVEEIQLFCEQIEGLICRLKEGDAVKDLLEKMLDFQQQAMHLLDTDTADSKSLQKCLDLGNSLDIELPEMPRLKQKLQQTTWLEEVQELYDDPQQVTLSGLRRLVDTGNNLPPHPQVEKSMGEMQELLSNAERWEEKARACLQSKPKLQISAVENIVKEASRIHAVLPNIVVLKDSLKKAKEWIAKVDSALKDTDKPFVETLESFLVKGRTIPIRLEQLQTLESHVAAAKTWRDKTSRTFLKKNSHYTLMEILCPRTDVGTMSLRRRRRVKDEQNTQTFQTNLLELSLEEAKDLVELDKAFRIAEQKEIEAMRELRIQNLQKRAADGGNAKYCICRKILSGYMLQCELCKDWFHATCVPLPKVGSLKGKPTLATACQLAMTKDLKFLCPCCLRSRRPRLETILSVLVSISKLNIRIAEGEALRTLTDRAMAWQDRARSALATEELSSALAKLSILSQRLVEASNREKTEKIISTELKKVAGNPELHQRVQNLSRMPNEMETDPVVAPSLLGDTASVEGENTNDSENSANARTTPVGAEEDDTASVDEGPGCYSNSEHAYSFASKSASNSIARKHSRKSPLVPRQLESPVLELSEMAKAQLEELMMEGDLLEVSLDETQHIWRILQATKQRREEKFPDFEELEQELIAAKAEKEKIKERKRKRKAEEAASGASKKLKVKIGRDPLSGDKNAKKKVFRAKKQIKDSRELKKIMKKTVKKKDGDKKKVIRTKKKEKEQSEDIEEDCAAEKCLKPTGMEVDWVQCDACQGWFHLHCVGLSKNDLKEDEDYHCTNCRMQEDELSVEEEEDSMSQMEVMVPAPHPPEVDLLLSLATSAPPLPVPPSQPEISSTNIQEEKDSAETNGMAV